MIGIEDVRKIVELKRVVEAPITLVELQAGSRCEGIPVRYGGDVWALKLQSGDQLKILAELEKARSVRKLPDYILFSSQRVSKRQDATLCVTVCELKSSEGGAAAALPQVQLGKLLAEYLVRIAAFAAGDSSPPSPWYCGLIASNAIPASMQPKGSTRPGKVGPSSFHDKLSGMEVFTVPCGGELRLESLY